MIISMNSLSSNDNKNLICPQIILSNLSEGAVVEATCGSGLVSAVSDASGVVTLDIPQYGTWTLSVTIDDSTYTKDYEIDFVKQYEISFSIESFTLKMQDKFSDNSWETIIYACQTNSVPDTWLVGDSKEMTVGGNTYKIDIIGKNHDTYSDGSGKAPLTFQFLNSWRENCAMHIGEYAGWGGCSMRQTTLPSIKNQMPAVVKNAIKSVNKLASAGGNSTAIATSSDALFLLSVVEVLGTPGESYPGEGTRYESYIAGNGTRYTLGGEIQNVYWTRSLGKTTNNNRNFYCISGNGVISYPSSLNLSIVPAFCF